MIRKAPIAILGFASIAAIAAGSLLGTGEKILYEGTSSFNGQIIVREDSSGVRSLLFEWGGAIQSQSRPGKPEELLLPYTRTMPVVLAYADAPARTLIVGLGGGTIPNFLHRRFPDMKIDAVDIDPAVIEVAKQFFDFQEDKNLKAHEADGRAFIEKSKEKYDLVVLDAYSADSIPYKLATREFLLEVRKILTPKGLVAANIWSRLSNPLYDSMVRTYQDVFEELYIFEVQGSLNRIFIAVPRKGKLSKEDVVKRSVEVTRKAKLPIDLGKAAEYGYSYATDIRVDAEVLLDSK